MKKIISLLENISICINSPSFNYFASRYIKTYFIKEASNIIDLNNDNGYTEITDLEYDYGFMNACFVNNILGLVLYLNINNTAPLLLLNDKSKKTWESFFCDFEKCDDYPIIKRSCFKDYLLRPQFVDFTNNESISAWTKLYNRYIKLNDNTQKYVDDEYAQILNGKKVLGCLCRGTDYNSKPKYHPIQPSLDEIMDECEIMMYKHDLKYIYLATEERNIFEKFESRFGKVVLENKRSYYDDIYYSKDMKLISEVKFTREDDNYLKSLEYLSSMYLLSKCDCFVGGLSGGTMWATYMNNNQYKERKILYYGVY